MIEQRTLRMPAVSTDRSSVTVFVISNVFPYRQHGEEGISAVHVVVREIISALNTCGFRVCVQVMFNEGHRALTGSEQEEINHLQESGFEVLPPLFVRNPAERVESLRRRVKRLFNESVSARVEAFYPTSRFRETISARVTQSRSDVILALWSPEGVAAASGGKTPLIAYQGDIDFAPWKSRLESPALFPARSRWPEFISRPLDRIRYSGFRRAHLKLMKKVSVIANVTDSNALFYSKQGHPRSIYVRNTWTDDGHATEHPDVPTGPPFKIIGHVGYLNRTGNTFGLHFLLTKLMPALDIEMQGMDYSVHIVGSGDIAAELRVHLQHPRLVLRGFVKDLDSELLSSHALLLLNNAGPYRAAFTRHIVAWSMRLCLVTHSNSQAAIPEMVHMENCLMSDSPADMAKLIRRSLTDAPLNRTLRQNGRRTYEQFFKPERIAANLAHEITTLLHSSGTLSN